jgi:YesN/AraC family two-component response regulator
LIVIILQNNRIKKSHKKLVAENIKSLRFEDENLKLKQIIEQKDKTKAEEIVDEVTQQEEENPDNELFNKIIDYMEKSKIYKNPDFSLNILAKELNTNRTYISRAINNASDKSFVELVNEYRISEAKRLLCSQEAKLLTIEAIGEKAGFKSKSTFFRVFKTITGVTPGFFLNNIDTTQV